MDGWMGENKAVMHFPRAFSICIPACILVCGFYFSAWHHHQAAAHRTSPGERVPQSAALCPEVPSTALCAGAVAVARGCEDLRGRPSRRVRNSLRTEASQQNYCLFNMYIQLCIIRCVKCICMYNEYDVI